MVIRTVFIKNRAQMVKLPAELRLPAHVKKVEVHANGIERIISPAAKSWDSFFLEGPGPTEDFLENRASQEAERVTLTVPKRLE